MVVRRDTQKRWERMLRDAGLLTEAEEMVAADRAVLLLVRRAVACRLLLSSGALYIMVRDVPAFSPAFGLPFEQIIGVLALRLREPMVVVKTVDAPDGEFVKLQFLSAASESFVDRFEAGIPGRWVNQPPSGRPGEPAPSVRHVRSYFQHRASTGRELT